MGIAVRTGQLQQLNGDNKGNTMKMFKAISLWMIMGLVSGFAFGQVKEEKKASPTKESPKKVDPIEELKNAWKASSEQVAQYEVTIKDQALQIQNAHIQMRDVKLQLKEIENKLQSKLCDKGTMLSIIESGLKYTCIPEGKPK